MVREIRLVNRILLANKVLSQVLLEGKAAVSLPLSNLLTPRKHPLQPVMEGKSLMMTKVNT